MKSLIITRRVSQAFFFALFVLLVVATQYTYSARKETVSGWLKFFYDINPLNLLGTSVAAGVLYATLALGLILLVATIFFGRFFCGWVCPLGSLNHFLSSFKSERRSRRGLALMKANVYKPYQSIKYYLLVILIAMAVFGSLQTGLFDPISTLGRSVAMLILPAVTSFLKTVFSWLWSVDFYPVSIVGEGLYRVTSAIFLPAKQPVFNGIFWLALIFGLIVVANRIYTRFWCRAICPLGALLGTAATFSVFGLRKIETTCDGCNKCLLHCQGGDNPHLDLPHHRAECHLCLNCLADCPRDALSFGFFGDKTKLKAGPDITRRKVIFASIAGILAVPMLRSGISGSHKLRPRLIRPPGSLEEEDFLARCIRCGQCMKICPTNALHPTLLDAGWEGIFTPILIPPIGYCEYSCVLCGQSCPTGAIAPLTLDEKQGANGSLQVRIGTAFIDRSRCLPWAFGKECIVCEEWCPVSPKAVILKSETVTMPGGKMVTLQMPYVSPELCNGCGACEYACPVEGSKAIYVHSVGETRNPANEMLLRRPRRGGEVLQ